MIDREFQVMPFHIIIELPKTAQAKRSRQDINIVLPNLEVIDEQVTNVIGHILINFYLHHGTEFSPANALLHTFQQVVRFDFLNLHVGISNDTEGIGGDNFQTGEEHRKVCHNQLFE